MMQNDTTHALQVSHQFQCHHANDSLIDDIPTSNGNPELDFDWILKLKMLMLQPNGISKSLL